VDETPLDTSLTLLGLDVAKYQDKMDAREWAIAYKMGYRFVFAKATDGITGKDSFYELHRRLAKQAGFFVGAYHFFRYGYDAKKQAEHFAKTANIQTGEMCAGDFEWDRYSANGKYGEGKRMDAAATDMAFTFLTEVERLTGVTPFCYTNRYFWEEKPKDAARFLKFPLWVPAYHTTIEKVKIPAPWKKPTVWQFADDLSLGDVKAIDENEFFGSLSQLEALTKK